MLLGMIKGIKILVIYRIQQVFFFLALIVMSLRMSGSISSELTVASREEAQAENLIKEERA